MTDFEANQSGAELGVRDYNLRLPPLAPAMPEDEPSVHLLARPEIREPLDEANAQITQYYRGLETEGEVVHELFRGTTHEGVAVAVAEHAAALDALGVDRQGYEGSQPIFGNVGKYKVFAYMLDELNTPEGMRLATTPRELIDIRQNRDGTLIGVAVEGGSVMLELPLSWEKPRISGEDIVSFRQAAFGERRARAAFDSLAWIFEKQREIKRQISDFRAAREHERADALKDQPSKLEQFYTQRLEEVYEHPEWIDAPGDPLAGIDDARLKELDLLKGVRDEAATADHFRSAVRGHVTRTHVINPNELAAIRAVVAPDKPDTRSTAWDSYYRRGQGVDGEKRAINMAISRYRASLLEQVFNS